MAMRQEQEPARRDVTEVAPQILRMELPIRMPGLGHVNCYAIVDDRGAALIDPGLSGPGSWRALQDRLEQADLATRHIHAEVDDGLLDAAQVAVHQPERGPDLGQFTLHAVYQRRQDPVDLVEVIVQVR